MEAERRRVEDERQRREEAEKVAKLHATLAEWREVRDIRAFIEDARAIAAKGEQVIGEGSNLADFIRWASARADRIDPLRVLRHEAKTAVTSTGLLPADENVKIQGLAGKASESLD